LKSNATDHLSAPRMYEIISLWDALGNPYSYALEVNMELSSSRKISSEMEEVDIDELRDLELCGAMVSVKRNADEFWRKDYKLTKDGLKWLKIQNKSLEDGGDLLEDLFSYPEEAAAPEQNDDCLSFLEEEMFRDDGTQILFREWPGIQISTGEEGIIYTYLDNDYNLCARFCSNNNKIKIIDVEPDDLDADEEGLEFLSEEAHMPAIEKMKADLAAAEKQRKKGIKRGK